MWLALEFGASRMVRAMDQYMATQASAACDLSPWGSIGQGVLAIGRYIQAAGQIGGTVLLRTMVTAMALLAKERRTRFE